jgi:uncharacterized membrane protein YraQ (UPF0718 family)/copper chaperone CopZ
MLETLGSVIFEFWGVLGEMAPYLLFGFLAAGALSVLVSSETVERHLGGGGAGPVVKATLFGVPLPLCSCGVIPVAASLRRRGASRGATAAFLLSVPQTGVDSVFVTLSLLGPVFAIFRPLAALVSGVLGGGVVSLMGSENGEGSGDEADCHDSCAVPEPTGRGRVARALRYGLVTLPSDIAGPMLAGLLIAGVIAAVVPTDYFARLLGTGIGVKLIMMVIGIPVYVCATASVPIAAVLVAKGVSPGAALVFLMTGPATNAAAIAIVWKLLGRRTAIVYLLVVALLSLGFGTLLDAIFTAGNLSARPGMPWMFPSAVKTGAAAVLLGILAAGILGPYLGRRNHSAKIDAQAVVLDIDGMTCSHCADAVNRALKEVEGVSRVRVDLKDGRAFVDGTGLDTGVLCGAVSDLGYRASAAGPGISSG